MKKIIILLMLLPLQNIYAQGYQPFRLHHNSNLGILQQSIEKMDEQHKRFVESMTTRLKETKILIDNQNYHEACNLLDKIIDDGNNLYLSEEIKDISLLRDYCKNIEYALDYMGNEYYKDAYDQFNKSLDLIGQVDYAGLFGESITKTIQMRDFCKEQVNAKKKKDLETIQSGIESAKEYMNNKNYKDAYALFNKSLSLIIQKNYTEHFRESIIEINQLRDFCKSKITSE